MNFIVYISNVNTMQHIFALYHFKSLACMHIDINDTNIIASTITAWYIPEPSPTPYVVPTPTPVPTQTQTQTMPMVTPQLLGNRLSTKEKKKTLD